MQLFVKESNELLLIQFRWSTRQQQHLRLGPPPPVKTQLSLELLFTKFLRFKVMHPCSLEVFSLSTSSFPPPNLTYGGWWVCGPFGCSLFLLFEHVTALLKRKKLLTIFFSSSLYSMLLFPSSGNLFLLSGLLIPLPSLPCMPGRWSEFYFIMVSFFFFCFSSPFFASYYSLDGWKEPSRATPVGIRVWKILCLLFLTMNDSPSKLLSYQVQHI